MRLHFLPAALLSSLVFGTAESAAQPSTPPRQGTPLPRCILYNSFQVTPQGMMRCSYQCGDRIIIRGGHMICAQSWARPEAGKP